MMMNTINLIVLQVLKFHSFNNTYQMKRLSVEKMQLICVDRV